MLNIYYANESIDKEKYIFEHIALNEGRTLLIVPDQFSAQTERNAFFYLGKKATMDLRVFHFERLGRKAIEEVGLPVPALIDKYGRHMLLTNIIRREEKAGTLATYKGMSEKNTFVTMMNSLISEMKRNEVTPELLEGVMGQLDENSFLARKLNDITHIFAEYEKDIEGKYLDSEDYITFYGDAIARAPMVAGASVWIYGFDTFTPKNMLVIRRLIDAAESVNVVMNYEDGDYHVADAAFLAEDDRKNLFDLTGYVIGKLGQLGEDAGVRVNVLPVDGQPRHSLWAREDGGASSITLVGASNYYEEAERAAEYILSLVRDEEYRYGDIVAICNDMSGLGAIFKRTLDKWGIPAFVDNKRTVLHHPAVGFVLALMDSAANGFKPETAMTIIKSGLMDFDADDSQLLENYIYKFKVRGSGWRKPFTKKMDNMSDENLERLNLCREALVDTVDRAKAVMGTRNSVSEKVKGLYSFLADEFMIEDRLEHVMDQQEIAGLSDAANETAQSWNVICSILEQISSVMGDKKISNIELKKLLTDGLEEIKIGLVPAHNDSVIIGTLQRSRLSKTKVIVVIGANEGVLPMDGKEEGILSDIEIDKLEGMNLTVGKTDTVMHGEESLAIYRNLTAPEDRLYMSYSKTNSKGEGLKASHVFELLKAYVGEHGGNSEELGDLDDAPDFLTMVGTPGGTLPRVAGAMRKFRDDGEMDDAWYQVINWYMEHDSEGFAKMRRGISFTNTGEKLGADLAEALYIGDRTRLKVSASRLEKYSGCPFSHFISSGLKAEELSPFEIDGGSRGDIYHECLMNLSRRLTATDGTAINDESSRWMTIDEDGCRAMVKDIITNELGDYKELMVASKMDEYRTARIIDICSKAAMSMIRQVQHGNIESMAFEEEFNTSGSLKPIIINVGDKEVVLRGKIDRLDILNSEGGEQAVRVVDYKTGAAEIKKEYYETGYKLQLMVYLNAAMANNVDMVPAGVFHFKIDEVEESNDDGKVAKKELESRYDKNYRLQGFVLGEEAVIRGMDKEFEDESNVIPVKYNKKGDLTTAAAGTLFSREEFEELCQNVNAQVQRICGEIIDGVIDIHPAKADKTTACKYCKYRSICVFDTSFAGCRYNKI